MSGLGFSALSAFQDHSTTSGENILFDIRRVFLGLPSSHRTNFSDFSLDHSLTRSSAAIRLFLFVRSDSSGLDKERSGTFFFSGFVEGFSDTNFPSGPRNFLLLRFWMAGRKTVAWFEDVCLCPPPVIDLTKVAAWIQEDLSLWLRFFQLTGTFGLPLTEKIADSF